MFARTGRFLIAVLALLLSATVVNAQQDSRPPAFTQEELDQILAPIALYPDSLLSQIMMAATYPREVAEAAQWSRSNSDLNGDRAVRAVERYDWDPSVKSIVAFPQILDMMDQKMNWTEDLGDAFLDQQAQVMDTVQYLRRQAYAAGNLQSSDQFRVDVRDSSFVIDFVNPEIAYLPYYNPVIVFGTWWWPTHQPVYWAPWPGYYARAGFRGYAWGPPIRISRGFFYGAPDWQHRRVNIVNVNNYYYRPSSTFHAEASRSVGGAPQVWQHDTAHRRDVPRRDAAWRQSPARVESAPDARRDAHGRPGNASSPAVATQPEARVAPSQPTVAAPAPGMTRGEPPRGAESRGYEPRGNDGRGFEGRGERMQRPETRIDTGNRAADRGHQQPAAADAPPVVTQARAAPAQMPVPTPPPVAARPEPRPNVAAAPRAPEGRQAGSRENGGRHASADNGGNSRHQ